MAANARITLFVCLAIATPGIVWGLSPEESLQKRVSCPFVRFPVEKMAEYLTDATRAVFELDPTIKKENLRPITCNYKDVVLREILDDLLPQYELTYEIVGGRVLITQPQTPLPPSERGHKLSPEEAHDGWLALFDGQTTFGWRDAAVEFGVLYGGTATSAFDDYSLRAEIVASGAMEVGGERIEVTTNDAPRRPFLLTRRVQKSGPIRLLAGAAVRSLHVRPLGLQPLLNGKDLTGWQRIDRESLPAEKRPQWRVENGVLRVTGGPGALEYSQGYEDFVLQLGVRTRAERANAGLFFRSIPGDFMNGYEAQIYNSCEEKDPARPSVYSTGSIDDRQLARRLVSRDSVPLRMTVVARGPHLATWVNGYQLIDWTDTRPPHENARKGLRLAGGTIQLQAHDPQTDVEFLSLEVAPLK